MPRMTYEKRNEEAISSLQGGLQHLVRFILYRLSRMGEDVLITEGFRTKEDQLKEYQEGNSEVLYPYSFHNHGAAVDVVPVRFGVPWMLEWGASSRYQNIAKVFAQWGFEWGYSLWGFDKPHFQFRQGKTINNFIKGYQITDTDLIKAIREAYDWEEKRLIKAQATASPKRKEQLIEELQYVISLRARLPTA